jgi:hypothetical protein
MKHHNKLTPQEIEAQIQAQAQQGFSNSQPLEFAQADQLLRHDSMHTPVPPSLAVRLTRSIGPAQQKPRSWWQRLFRKH